MRRHSLLAVTFVGVLALGACDTDAPVDTDAPADTGGEPEGTDSGGADPSTDDGDAPGDDASADDGAPTDGTDASADGADGEGFAAEDVDPASIADGEVLPGVRLEVPDTAVVTTAELPNGRSYIGALDDEEVAVFVEVSPDGPDVATRTADVESLGESGQGTLEEPTAAVDVDGADDAARVAATDPSGRVTATMVAITAGRNAVTVIVEAPVGTEVDVDAILATLAIDPARLDV